MLHACEVTDGMARRKHKWILAIANLSVSNTFKIILQLLISIGQLLIFSLKVVAPLRQSCHHWL